MSRNDALLEAFAAELRDRRFKAKLSQEQLAHQANVNRTYIAKLELAKNQPSLCVLHDLAAALGDNFQDLITGVMLRYEQKKRARMDVRGYELSHPPDEACGTSPSCSTQTGGIDHDLEGAWLPLPSN